MSRTRTRPRFRDPWFEAGLLPGNACGSPPIPKLKAEDEFELEDDWGSVINPHHFPGFGGVRCFLGNAIKAAIVQCDIPLLGVPASSIPPVAG
jgi:hypothetical protein